MEKQVRTKSDCAAHEAMRIETENWAERVPADEDEFLPWCLQQSQGTLLSLLAFAAACSANALHGKWDGETSPRLHQANTLANALSLDMGTWWQPSVEEFYERLPKAQMLHIVKEAKAPFAINTDKLKKQEVARHVAKAVTGSGRLPAPLRPATEPVCNAA